MCWKGELPLEALPPAGQVVILAGKRWLVQNIDTSSKTVWVLPAKGGKIPVFLGSGGELHSRVVQEMKAVLLETDEPAFLNEPSLELLRAARHVARTVGLDRTNALTAPGGVRWFPWTGTRCIRTIAILAELNGLACETDRLSLWLPLNSPNELREFQRRLLTTEYDPQEIGSRVTPRTSEKFDEFLPDDLLNRASVCDRLSLDEARLVLEACALYPD